MKQFIVTKSDLLDNSIDVIAVEEILSPNQKDDAHKASVCHALEDISDVKKENDNITVRVIDYDHYEVYETGYFGKHLKFIYRILLFEEDLE
jgi:hypothetical protein